MINWNGIILTSVFTIMGGVIVFCISQIVLKFFIEPIQKLDMCRGEICDVLIFNRNIYLNPNTVSKEKELEVSIEIRKAFKTIIEIDETYIGGKPRKPNKRDNDINLKIREVEVQRKSL